MNQASIRVVIADDHFLIREGLKASLKKCGDIELMGEARDGKELVELVRINAPDVVLTDLRMPSVDGVEATKRIKAIAPETAILALSFMDNIYAIIEVLEAGAMGYLAKTAPITDVFDAIFKAREGIPYFCHTTTKQLARQIARSGFDPYKKFRPELTSQQVRIIRLISKGMTSKEIGERLDITERTVEGHRSNILEKLQVKNPVGIMMYAVKKGLVSIEELP